MLSADQKIAFAIFALLAIAVAARNWTGLVRRIIVGRRDMDLRFDRPIPRLWNALCTVLTQRRVFRRRPVVSALHSLIFYGFIGYLIVNLIDAAQGYLCFEIRSTSAAGAVYNLLADVLGALILVGVIGLVIRRFASSRRHDFDFNERTMLHSAVQRRRIELDSVIVSAFILIHVGSHALGAGARLSVLGADRLQPFATLVALGLAPAHANLWMVVGYWGSLGSVLCFLAYFPQSKHIHIFMAPAKYVVARRSPSGVLPIVSFDMDADAPQLGASRLEDLAWPRLLDSYACIQCNRCQDVCPASATGKSLSPAALEINKRMELNDLSRAHPAFERGAPSPRPLLAFAITSEAVWGCTTCGACLDICPVQDEPMLDIIDIRRHQVMMEGMFPAPLQAAFRGMERSSNPWGLSQDTRLDWAHGLSITTTETNPDPDVLFWVGCAASYDPQSQKTARAFVQLLNHAGVNFAVLGKKECCTGDTARRAGNEYLYRQLADHNVSALNQIHPKLIVATCPHCMNSIGKEYQQIGGSYNVLHHTQYLEMLVAQGRLHVDVSELTVAFHDPCYLGRHGGVYDAPRQLLREIGSSVVELDRNRESSFCCGAGGAQFWKEEEPGNERISDNRYQEVERTLGNAPEPVLAVGCPFCKSMLQSTPGRTSEAIAIKDVAELLLEAVERKLHLSATHPAPKPPVVEPLEGNTLTMLQQVAVTVPTQKQDVPLYLEAEELPAESVVHTETKRRKWMPKAPQSAPQEALSGGEERREELPAHADSSTVIERKKWSPKSAPSKD